MSITKKIQELKQAAKDRLTKIQSSIKEDETAYSVLACSEDLFYYTAYIDWCSEFEEIESADDMKKQLTKALVSCSLNPPCSSNMIKVLRHQQEAKALAKLHRDLFGRQA